MTTLDELIPVLAASGSLLDPKSLIGSFGLLGVCTGLPEACTTLSGREDGTRAATSACWFALLRVEAPS